MNGADEPPTRAAASQDASQDASQAIHCPFCGSTETEEMDVFGSQLSTAQRYCRACHTPFERLTRTAGRTNTAGGETLGD